MNRFKIVVVLLLFFLTFPAAFAAGNVREAEMDQILSAAENVFQNMKRGDYPQLWRGLTAETQLAIIKSSKKSLEKNRIEYDEAQIRRDFETGGMIAQGYWAGYLLQFNPTLVLEESAWSMGEVRKEKAEIVIRYRKSDRDAILRMFQEDGVWKVGLDETFSPRKGLF